MSLPHDEDSRSEDGSESEDYAEKIKELDKTIQDAFIQFNSQRGEVKETKEEYFRKRNALYSQRKYYRKKLATRNLYEDRKALREINAELKAQNESLEKLHAWATEQVALIEGRPSRTAASSTQNVDQMLGSTSQTANDIINSLTLASIARNQPQNNSFPLNSTPQNPHGIALHNGFISDFTQIGGRRSDNNSVEEQLRQLVAAASGNFVEGLAALARPTTSHASHGNGNSQTNTQSSFLHQASQANQADQYSQAILAQQRSGLLESLRDGGHSQGNLGFHEPSNNLLLETFNKNFPPDDSQDMDRKPRAEPHEPNVADLLRVMNNGNTDQFSNNGQFGVSSVARHFDSSHLDTLLRSVQPPSSSPQLPSGLPNVGTGQSHRPAAAAPGSRQEEDDSGKATLEALLRQFL